MKFKKIFIKKNNLLMDFKLFLVTPERMQKKKNISAKVIEDLEIDSLIQIRGKIKNKKWGTINCKTIELGT